MPTKLLGSNIWRTITAAAKRSRADVAVAYFGSGGADLLPLRSGSTLTVDMSKVAVVSGQTNPKEIRKLLKRNIMVHSVENLHAKVFVFNGKAVLGSTNVSHNSAENLVEAALETSDSRLISSLRSFVRSLHGESVTPQYVKEMEKLYRPPKFGNPKRGSTPIPTHERVIVVQTVHAVFNNEENAQNREGLRAAKTKLRNTVTSKVENFLCEGSCRYRKGDILLQVFTQGRKTTVCPQGRVIYLRPFLSGHERKSLVYLEINRKSRGMNIKRVIARLGRKAKTKLSEDGTLRGRAFIHGLLHLLSPRH